MDAEKQVEILKRNVVDLVSEEELLERIKKKGRLRVKLGVDPSRPDLHLGHAVVLRKLREFQNFGHTVILIIGDFTARIGDPSGRSKTRPMLSKEEVQRNAQTYAEQAFKILDISKTELRFNGEWLDKLNFEDVIRLAARYTVSRMLERDDFWKRYQAGEPISISEFLYPLAQGYDSVAIEADVELGGTDQYFNLIVARHIQQSYGQEPEIVMTMPIIEGTDGHLKMSKSYGNYVAFNDPPEEMYGKIMSIPDHLILKYMKLLTDVDDKIIEEYRAKIERREVNPRDVKMHLAREVVASFYNREKAVEAEEKFVKVFRKKEVPEDIPEVAVEAVFNPIDLLVDVGAASSRSEAKRLIMGGGVKLDGEVIRDFSDCRIQGPSILRVGKRRFYRLVPKT
ncbi:MAG: tyrosine--tRNA ligase [Thermotogae bacterium]|nr:tyrosine--tRNA ligase [Thermotogota bacterium]